MVVSTFVFSHLLSHFIFQLIELFLLIVIQVHSVLKGSFFMFQ